MTDQNTPKDDIQDEDINTENNAENVNEDNLTAEAIDVENVDIEDVEATVIADDEVVLSEDNENAESSKDDPAQSAPPQSTFVKTENDKKGGVFVGPGLALIGVAAVFVAAFSFIGHGNDDKIITTKTQDADVESVQNTALDGTNLEIDDPLNVATNVIVAQDTNTAEKHDKETTVSTSKQTGITITTHTAEAATTVKVADAEPTAAEIAQAEKIADEAMSKLVQSAENIEARKARQAAAMSAQADEENSPPTTAFDVIAQMTNTSGEEAASDDSENENIKTGETAPKITVTSSIDPTSQASQIIPIDPPVNQGLLPQNSAPTATSSEGLEARMSRELDQKVGAVEDRVADKVKSEVSDQVADVKADILEQTAREKEEAEAALREQKEKLAAQQAEIDALKNLLDSAISTQAAQVQATENKARQLENRFQQMRQNDMAMASKNAVVAIALNNLTQAINGGRPYKDELKVLSAQLPNMTSLARLEKYADDGLPTAAALKAEFSPLSDQSIAAAKREQAQGVWGSISSSFTSMFVIRKTGLVEGDTPAAIISRTEYYLQEENFTKALSEIDALTGDAKIVMTPWVEKAKLREDANDMLANVSNEILKTIR